MIVVGIILFANGLGISFFGLTQSVTFAGCTITFLPGDQGGVLLENPDLTAFGGSFQPGATVPLTVNLNNISTTGTCDPSQWQLTVYYAATTGTVANYAVLSSPLSAFSGAVSLTFTAPSTPGTYTLGAQIQGNGAGNSCSQNCGVGTATFTVAGNPVTTTTTTTASATQTVTVSGSVTTTVVTETTVTKVGPPPTTASPFGFDIAGLVLIVGGFAIARKRRGTRE